jgi:anti-sigma factor RsiW
MKSKARKAIKKHDRLEDLMLYAGSSLDLAERTELEAHLKTCADCQRELKDIRLFLPALQKALVPDEPSAEELLAWGKSEMEKKKRRARKR